MQTTTSPTTCQALLPDGRVVTRDDGQPYVYVVVHTCRGGNVQVIDWLTMTGMTDEQRHQYKYGVVVACPGTVFIPVTTHN